MEPILWLAGLVALVYAASWTFARAAAPPDPDPAAVAADEDLVTHLAAGGAPPAGDELATLLAGARADALADEDRRRTP